jgi:hypothetical protein
MTVEGLKGVAKNGKRAFQIIPEYATVDLKQL